MTMGGGCWLNEALLEFTQIKSPIRLSRISRVQVNDVVNFLLELEWPYDCRLNRNLHKSCVLFEFQIHLRQFQNGKTMAHPVSYL